MAEYALIMPAIGYLFYDKPAAGLVMIPYIPIYIRQRCRDFERRRKEKTAAAFKDGMQIISTELSAGYSLENAFRESLGEIEMLYGQDSEIYKSFAEIAARININTNIEDAFADFAGNANVEEIDSYAQVQPCRYNPQYHGYDIGQNRSQKRNKRDNKCKKAGAEYYESGSDRNNSVHEIDFSRNV